MLFEYGFLAGVVSGLGNVFARVWYTFANPVADNPLLFAAAGVLLLALVLRRR